jgi:hypothetical protein
VDPPAALIEVKTDSTHDYFTPQLGARNLPTVDSQSGSPREARCTTSTAPVA